MLAKIEVVYSPDSLFYSFSGNDLLRPIEEMNEQINNEACPIKVPVRTQLNLVALYELKRPAGAFVLPTHRSHLYLHYKKIQQFFPIRKPIHNRFQEKIYSLYFDSNEHLQPVNTLMRSIERIPYEKRAQEREDEEMPEMEEEFKLSEAISSGAYLPAEGFELLQQFIEESGIADEPFVISVYCNGKDGCLHLHQKVISKRLIQNFDETDKDSSVETFTWKSLTSSGLDSFLNIGGDRLIDKKNELWRKQLELNADELVDSLSVFNQKLQQTVSAQVHMKQFETKTSKWIFVSETFRFEKRVSRGKETDKARGLEFGNQKQGSAKLTEDQITFLRHFYPSDMKKIEQAENKKKTCGFRVIR